MLKNFTEVLDKAKKMKNIKLAVVSAHDEEVLEAVEEARKENIADSILIGDKDKILDIMKKKNILPEGFKIINIKDETESALKAIELVKKKKVHCIVKGKIKTPTLMKSIVNKEYGILTGQLLSHILIISPKKTNNFILISDGGMVIKPSLKDKEGIIKNALLVAKSLKLKPVQVALLSGPPCLDDKNASGKDAGLLAAEFKAKYSGSLKFEITGPVDFEETLKFKHPANVFIMPEIETGNIVGKSFMYLTDSDCGLLILGAKVPVVVTSRADTAQTKLNSIALACLAAKTKVNFN
ncbi:MAG: phosphate acyltransferase [Armatimonadota bacterium]